MNEKKSYKSILKANALFGGVQIYNIIISVVRSKAIALILGPQGMGIIGLLNTTLSLIQSTTNMGLSTSAVREVAIVGNNVSRISEVKTVLMRMVGITGFLGAVLTFLFAPLLSNITFGNNDYISSFRWLSITLLLLQLTVGQNALLQGLRRLKALAKSSVFGNLIALILCLPLYYFWGIVAIVPVIIIPVVVNFILSAHFVKQIHISPMRISFKETFCKGKNMVYMGFLISLTGIMDTIVAYLIRIMVGNNGGISEVGLYNAGYVMITGYVGLVFSSISTDYFPRLSAVSTDKTERNNVICRQADIMLLILCPIILVFISFGNIVIEALYSKEFLSIVKMVNWIALGMMFRALSWCPGFLYLAKNDSKLYIVIYIITTIVVLLFNIFLYKLMGLTGIGLAFLLINFLSFILTLLITKWRYDFTYRNNTLKLGVIQVFICILALSASYINSDWRYVIFTVFILFSGFYSYHELNKRIDMVQIINSIKGRFLKRFE
jgi:O-antigen/teichoic acid export membrane protein